jgi:predicted transglutaminase-like cysteine proteinase
MSVLPSRAGRIAAAGAVVIAIAAVQDATAKERARKPIFDDLVTPSMMVQATPPRPVASNQPRFFSIAGVLAKLDGKPSPDADRTRVASATPDATVASDAPAALGIPSAGPQEPFGLLSFRAPEGTLWRKWREAGRAIQRDIAALAACRADRSACSAAIDRFEAIVSALRGSAEERRIETVNRLVNQAVAYASDISQHGTLDTWSSPLETLGSGRGDCEDYAIAKYVALREAGTAEADLRILLGRDRIARQDHAVVAVRRGETWIILDNRWTAIHTDGETASFTPLFALGAGGVSLFASPYLSGLTGAVRPDQAPDMTPASASLPGAADWTGGESEAMAGSAAAEPERPYLL